MKKKTEISFDIQDLLPIGITIGILGVALSFMASMQADVRADQTADTIEYNISTNALEGQNKLAVSYTHLTLPTKRIV